MIFRFVSDDDWHSLFQEKREGTSGNFALSSVFARRCAAENPGSFINSIKVIDRRFQKFSNSNTLSKEANNGN